MEVLVVDTMIDQNWWWFYEDCGGAGAWPRMVVGDKGCGKYE